MTKPDTPEHARQRREILAHLDAVGLSARRDELAALYRPAIALHTRDGTPADDAVGCTRVGGEPDLPPDLAWPEGEEGPLLFVLQVDLAAVAPFDLEARLPSTGVLSVFLDRWGQDLRVLHLVGLLERRPWISPWRPPFRRRGVDLRPELQPPPPASSFVGGENPLLELTSDEHDVWWDEVWLAWRERWRPGPAGTCGIHQLLGYAAAEQFEAQRATEEVIVGVDSDDGADMNWGDVHTVWGLIERADLDLRRWDRVRAEM
jgi:hypothetical protein